MPETWKAIAIALGNRMSHHDYCDHHSLAEADPENCPFCEDRAVYRRFVAKVVDERKKGRM